MKGVPEELIKNYVDSIPSSYDENVKSNFLSPDFSVEKVEDSLRKAYELEGVEVKSFVWIKDPIQAKSVMGDKEYIYPSYFNINWLFFFKTYYEMLKENESQLTDEFDKNWFVENEKTYKQACLVYEVMLDIFGVNEVDGVVYIIEKPKAIRIVGDELHSLEGPSVEYNTDANLYHIEGVEMPPEMWVSIVKSMSEQDLIDDGNNIEKVRESIAFVEKTHSTIEPMDVNKVFKIENLEQKSKAVKYMGYDKILAKADLVDESTVVTHKGETKVYQLLEMDLGLEIDDNGEPSKDVKSRFVKVSCWSTDRDYILMVDPRSEQCKTAMGAIAWTCQNPITGERCTVQEYNEMTIET